MYYPKNQPSINNIFNFKKIGLWADGYSPSYLTSSTVRFSTYIPLTKAKSIVSSFLPNTEFCKSRHNRRCFCDLWCVVKDTRGHSLVSGAEAIAVKVTANRHVITAIFFQKLKQKTSGGLSLCNCTNLISLSKWQFKMLKTPFYVLLSDENFIIFW